MTAIPTEFLTPMPARRSMVAPFRLTAIFWSAPFHHHEFPDSSQPYCPLGNDGYVDTTFNPGAGSDVLWSSFRTRWKNYRKRGIYDSDRAGTRPYRPAQRRRTLDAGV